MLLETEDCIYYLHYRIIFGLKAPLLGFASGPQISGTGLKQSYMIKAHGRSYYIYTRSRRISRTWEGTCTYKFVDNFTNRYG